MTCTTSRHHSLARLICIEEEEKKWWKVTVAIKKKNFFSFFFFFKILHVAQCYIPDYSDVVWTKKCGRGRSRNRTLGLRGETSVGSEQGWFVLALYNLSNFSLMLTVPILFVRHFKKRVKMCKSSLVFESEHSCDRGWAVIFTSTGQMRFSWLLCNTWKKKTTKRKRKRKKKHLSLQYFVDSRPQRF